jgi:hypothetical protein
VIAGVLSLTRSPIPALWRLLIVALLLCGSARAAAGACTMVPLLEGGHVVGGVCAEAPEPGRIVLALGDGWAPRIFDETGESALPYRATFVDLANERFAPDSSGDGARRDRYFELFGIFPSFSVIRVRLLDGERHACHASVDDGALRALERTLTPWDPKPSSARAPARRASLSALQRHLACEGLLQPGARAGVLDAPTGEALAAYQRRHMLPSLPVLDAETRATLLTDSRELDYRMLLRALRERVVDATGLLEDGSAGNAWQPILGRQIDSVEYRQVLRERGLERAAPDRVARATEAAAVALGWVTPERASAALDHPLPARVALTLPPPPGYHASPMQLHVELDRGDVWAEYPRDAQGRSLPSPVRDRATLVLFARTDEGEVPLVRWPTTIGGWKREKVSGGVEVLRYKPSPVGHFVWRDMLVAPAWFPPASTPERELVRRSSAGGWIANTEAVGPGYASAYGLLALLHHRELPGADGTTQFMDSGVRSHGSGNYRSILRGSSHGCHRLFNHLAIRLGSFLLAHHAAVRHGQSAEAYERVLRWRGRRISLRAASRGYRYELSPPIAVDVLPGHVVHTRRAPPQVSPSAGPAPREAALQAFSPDQLSAIAPCTTSALAPEP